MAGHTRAGDPAATGALGWLEAVVFDMDGTLVDSSAVVPDAYIDTIRACGGPAYERSDIVAAYSLGPPPVLLSHMLGREAAPAEVEAYYERLRATAGRIPLYPGIRRLVAACRRRGPVAVYTGASHLAATIVLSATGLLPSIGVLVGGDEVEHVKPAPDGVLRACNRLGVAPARAAYVGDARIDMEAARRAGALPIAAGWGHQFEPSDPAEVVFARPADLARALAVPSGSVVQTAGDRRGRS